MEIILSTGSLYKYSLAETFQIAESAGFDGIELLIERNNCNVSTDYIKGLSNKYNVPVLSLHSPFMSCDGWGGFWDSIWRSMVLAMGLAVSNVNFHPPTSFFPRHILNDELTSYIKAFKEELKDSDMILTIENLPTIKMIRNTFINRLFPGIMNNMYKIVEFSRANEILVTFDTTHVGTTGVNLLEAYSVFKDRIANIHLSDYDGRSQHLLPGTGYLPLKKLLNQIKEDEYNGLITLETCPEAMEYKEKSSALNNAKSGFKYIRDALGYSGF